MKVKLFVPGRLCLFGEHSDWAGMHRMINSDVEIGHAIVTGVEEGIYATAELCDEFIVESKLPIYNGERLRCKMNTDELMLVAKQGGFFSYVAGVAKYVKDNYSVGGLRIDITAMDLPMKSGLSSSAAICVLVARAFNLLYDLKMNIKGEMQVAFRGEQLTPSRCGRLDQACAYGIKPVYMEFDGTELESRPLRVGNTMYWVIADLHASKDTVKILSDLNKCYPFAESKKEQLVHEALGKDNTLFVQKAVELLEKGDSKQLGSLMIEVQENFDKKVAPACPEQLTAPVLHSVLTDENIKKWVYGCKGVGSQGDGTVQFLAKDLESRNALIKYLEEQRGMSAFSLTLKPGQTVKKAIIPVAGFGTRLFPFTKGLKKDFLPFLDSDGVLKPVLLHLLEQLDEAGIEEICLVIGEEEKQVYDAFFSPLPENYKEKLSKGTKKYEEEIIRLGKKVTYAYQKERMGFGHAVYQCRAFTMDEPVLLLLGDMIYESFEEKNCSRQIIEAFENCGRPLVGLHTISKSEVVHYGVAHGIWENDFKNLMEIDTIYEKPTCDYAEEYLAMDGKEEYYAVFGQYVLTTEVFKELEYNIENNIQKHGEFQLTDALDVVRKKSGLYGFVPNGNSFDVGLPESYINMMLKYGKK